MAALCDQPPGKGRLIDIVVIVLPDLLEGLDADGEAFASHGHHLSHAIRRLACRRLQAIACRDEDAIDRGLDIRGDGIGEC